ncbi:MAG: hypothetical protein J5598_03225 [Clostridia bacterium]|nr:hypothetical protein [Clostridia bacterium]
MAKKVDSKKIRNLNPAKRKPYGVYSRFDEYFNLLLNSVQIKVKSTGKGLDYATEHYVKYGLFDGGAMGYDKVVKKWASCYGEGLNEQGNPTTLIFVTANGKTWTRDAYYEDKEDGAYLVKALPNATMTMSSLIKETTDFMTNCDVAMRQNLEACKTPFIVVCKDEDLRLSIEQAIQQKQQGQAVLVVSEQLGDGLKSIDIGVNYLCDKFKEIRDEERNTLLNKIGIMTNSIEKRERVQSAEVNATIGQATDYIYLLIDTFNKQCKTYGLDYEMVLNGSLEEIYVDADGDGQVDKTADNICDDEEGAQ